MSKKPTISEIRARPACLCSWNPPSDRDYLLDLVSRMGKSIRDAFATMETEWDENDPWLVEARALLEEVKK